MNADLGEVHRWLISMSEPLLPPRVAAQLEFGARRFLEENRSMGKLWFAGVIHDTLASLPKDDPWRRGEISGTWKDGVDLVPRIHSDITREIGLAALAEGISEEAVYLIQQAARGWEAARKALIGMPVLFSTGASALRWVTWRRRVYAGADDGHLYTCGMLWLDIIGHLGEGRIMAHTERDIEAEGAKIPDDLYRPGDK